MEQITGIAEILLVTISVISIASVQNQAAKAVRVRQHVGTRDNESEDLRLEKRQPYGRSE